MPKAQNSAWNAWNRKSVRIKPREVAAPSLSKLENLRQSPLAAEIDRRVRERVPMQPIKGKRG